MKAKRAKVRNIAVITVVILLVTCMAERFTADAGDLEPTAPPGPTMKTLDEVEPRIPIPASATPVAPFVIENPGSYYLTGDRYASGTGIELNADNVTIDLMGYSLIGPDSGTNYGIYMDGRSNVEVRNGTVRNFGYFGFIDVAGGRQFRVIGIRALSNGNAGIYLTGYGHLVKDCTASENGNTGIYAGSGGTVTGNTAYKNQNTGISAGTGCTVTGNTAYLNQEWGIFLGGNSLVDQNTAYENNQSAGPYGNMNNPGPDNCTFGVNHAP